MANKDAAFGFRAIGSAGGGPYNGSTMRCLVPAAASEGPLFIGDVVTNIGTADVDGYVHVTEATATEAAYGVVASFEADEASSLPYRAALTKRYVNVIPCVGNFFVVQADGVMDAGDVGLNAVFAVGAGSTATGYSTTEMSATDIAASAGKELKIIGFLNSPDNDLTLTNAVAIVQFTEAQLGSVQSVGV